MAKNTYKNTAAKKEKPEKQPIRLNFSFYRDRRFQLASGFMLMIFSLFLLAALTSYLFTGKADQSIVQSWLSGEIIASGMDTANWLGLFGAILSHYFIFRWFGLAAFLLVPLFFLVGYKIVFRRSLYPLRPVLRFSAFFVFWLGITFGYLVWTTGQESNLGFLSGGIGYELAVLFASLIGWGTYLLLAFALIVFLIYFFNITEVLKIAEPADEVDSSEFVHGGEPIEGIEELVANKPFDKDKQDAVIIEDEEEDETAEWQIRDLTEPKKKEAEKPAPSLEMEVETPNPDRSIDEPAGLESVTESKAPDEEPKDEMPELDVEEVEEEKTSDELTNYDPTLDLGSYQYPTLDLLNKYDEGSVSVSKEELESNKDKIVGTLANYNIGIASIKATIGPTVTLYEIVPDAGVRISKIKNLEDDIALSLSALGIRIIAPIPGKGTIGIEVPNTNREMVSIRSVLNTEKFMQSDKDLPVALGRTISNEVFIMDLAKMPHLLMAGATGQGKSVGLNVLLTCLIYKKHPSQLKFVLIDPKKVELSIFNKIERHFLATLPDAEEPIITDTKKVINTLNSLCIEMDQRYDLLKEAGCRNLKEYNAKFVRRRLNPEKGHRFMPFIVLVIDELADLMMTAGKEVETPIARLAQLARAIGIHLVVATQRPSVNVITGIIKANFPARLSFKVTSKIDSRTILDTGGADQLVGMGDMLLSNGSDLTRIQCAFVDTPEVDRICEFIGSQRGYETAYLLPEFVGDDNEASSKDVDLANRDEMFDEAARTIVLHQQGSTSLLQRKLKLGYNRAGRIIDQLEAAGVVGPFEGSKAREVLVHDEYSLEQLLNQLNS